MRVVLAVALMNVVSARIDTTLHPLGTPIRLLEKGEYRAMQQAQLHAIRKYPFKPFSAAYVAKAKSATVDWRERGAVTAAKDQGAHGFCGTFARLAAAEGQFALHSGQPAANFSVQQLVDCVGWDKDQCSVIVDGKTGLMTATAYPYNQSCATKASCDMDPPVPGNPCKYDAKKTVRGSTGFTNMTSVPSNTPDLEDQLAAFIMHNGPVQSGIYAPVFGLRDNATCGGVGGGCWVTSASCATVQGKDIDHAITLIGFGHDTTLDQKTGKPYGDYWLVKNSWSTAFADNGFIKIARGVNCGNLRQVPGELFTYGDAARYYE